MATINPAEIPKVELRIRAFLITMGIKATQERVPSEPLRVHG